MPQRRSMLLQGLRLLITIPGPLLWTYAVNLGIALLFSWKLHAQFSSILDHSLAAERLNSAFDLGTVEAVFHRISYQAPSIGSSSYAGLPLYLLIYFLLVPGTLFCFRSEVPGRLSTMLGTGIAFFWRFIRIILVTGLTSVIILGPLLFLYKLWADHVDEHTVELSALFHRLPLLILIVLVAALIRLYFDLVEVYTIQLADHLHPNAKPDAKPDRRIRRTLLPALRTLRRNFSRAYLTFLFLTLLGFLAIFLTGRIALHTLAQPRVWPQFLLAQLGLFLMLATRFWQRAAETVLCTDNPIPYPLPFAPTPPAPLIEDPQPSPEPIAPSLYEPDPAVFHHEIPKLNTDNTD